MPASVFPSPAPDPRGADPANRETRRLRRLLEVVRDLAYTASLEAYLQAIVAAVCELIPCEAASIFLYEEETGLLRFVASPSDQLDRLATLRVPLEQSLAGECFRSGRVVVANQAAGDARIFRAVDQALEFETASLAAAPLIYRGRTLGVLEAVNRIGSDPSQYTAADLSTLETLAAQAAVALQDATLAAQAEHACRERADLERMKANFIGIAGHELRTPLGLILGHASLLSESEVAPAAAAQIAVILENAHKLRAILDHLTQIAPAPCDGEARQVFSLSAQVLQILPTFNHLAAARQITLMLELAPDGLMIEADRHGLEVVVTNLLKNALTFTNPGGHILISGEDLPGYVRLTVVDDGIGIPAVDQNRIFERFFQVESHLTRQHGGLGVGLAVAKAIVEAHGGEIWVESVVGRGSNFTFLLPKGAAGPAAQLSQGKTPAFRE
jgi:two-component system phosphate regulon sensor histidine kinase PhoR